LLALRAYLRFVFFAIDCFLQLSKANNAAYPDDGLTPKETKEMALHDGPQFQPPKSPKNHTIMIIDLVPQ
jgi:hypothetical protein